jgi:hypothetical protein
MPLDIDIDPMVTSALEQVAEEVHQEILRLIQSPEWEWPRETRRKNRQVVTSPRDIVDLGHLLRGQDYRIEGNRIIFFNKEDHSKLVHEGGSNGKAILPGRPFMTTAMANLDVVAKVAEYLGYEIEEWAVGTVFRDPATGRFTGKGLKGADTDTELTDFNY